MVKDNPVYFYGVASSYTKDCAEIADQSKRKILGYIHNQPTEPVPDGLEPLFQISDLGHCDRNIPVVIPLITPNFRKRLKVEVLDHGFRAFADMLHPSAVIARSCRWGPGLSVNAGVVVAANTHFGEHVLINRSVSIGHDVEVEDYVSFGPGAVLGGQIKIGEGAFIGVNATILPGVVVGPNSIVGGGAVVTKEVPANSVVVGNPATVIRTGIQGYNSN
ncbi:MAG: NeuD/PglB/VioB family sugar acetyltransferase [Verrucomicrobiota bacterium]